MADVTSALEALARLDGVPEAAARAREASAALRWHEGLRRRWREARAETAVRSAVAGAVLEGAPVEAAWLRGQVATGAAGLLAGTGPGAPSAAEAHALALWRAQVHVGELLGDLGGRGAAPVAPAAELLAGLHRDLTAHLATVGRLPWEAVGRPRSTDQPREAGPAGQRPGGAAPPAPVGAELEARLVLLRAVVDAAEAPALVRVGVAHAELATLRPFLTGNAALGRAVARVLAVRSGLEPTGVAVLDAHAAARPAEYRAALAGYASGTAEGVAGWLVFQAACVEAGARAGAEVATAVLAGRVTAG